ncbi:adenosylcobinamide-GDP ribazoletransferase [Amaricoccus solimangrovi]|uniref:Adenosylcobinamide-GDP ribazoletransferase n=1 Tax=Amaricoccus solimangrovi TaxID=2589815 RepID=A0A501W9I7_9RHOB|nr:adenosylcobinamide-GDP ribazoletransferase [Amaricoccus solimangrovi]TPE46613.1 adenosylcobinamide-GDP ribazoletransferase [Amaricoccus solimangrovi]
MRGRLAAEWASFLLACQFLTRLPIPARWDAGRMAAAPRWYPAAGLVVGALAAAAYGLAALRFGSGLAALAALGAGMLVTGCLHEDGFADVCDGIGGGASRERALEIMRDSRLGTYGVAGLALMLLARWQALAELRPALIPLALLAGHAASRASCVAAMAGGTYARAAGAAASVAGGVGWRSVAVAALIAAAPVLALLILAPVAALAGVAALALAHLATRLWYGRRLGGYTGDCLGAVQQTGELAFYLGLLGWS